MADYYNLFTTVQAKGPVHHGVELGPGNSPRFGHPAIFGYWARLAMPNWVRFIWVDLACCLWYAACWHSTSLV